MATNNHGHNPIGTFSDAADLPGSATTEYSTAINIADLGGQAEIAVYANSAITIATGNLFNIEIEKSADGTTYVALFDDDSHVYLTHKTTADDELAILANAVIGRVGIAKDTMDGYDYIRLAYTVGADQSAGAVDALLIGNM